MIRLDEWDEQHFSPTKGALGRIRYKGKTTWRFILKEKVNILVVKDLWLPVQFGDAKPDKIDAPT